MKRFLILTLLLGCSSTTEKTDSSRMMPDPVIATLKYEDGSTRTLRGTQPLLKIYEDGGADLEIDAEKLRIAATLTPRYEGPESLAVLVDILTATFEDTAFTGDLELDIGDKLWAHVEGTEAGWTLTVDSPFSIACFAQNEGISEAAGGGPSDGTPSWRLDTETEFCRGVARDFNR